MGHSPLFLKSGKSLPLSPPEVRGLRPQERDDALPFRSGQLLRGPLLQFAVRVSAHLRPRSPAATRAHGR